MGGPGVATGAGTKVDVTLKLSQLQNLCKRDPQGYREDYDAQVRRLRSECGIIALNPSDLSPRLVELIQFSAAVSSSSYKGEESDRIAKLLMTLLVGTEDTEQGNVNMSMPTAALQLHRDVRKACVSALILMRNKGALEPLRLLELFFRIMAVVPDKALRELLYRHIVNDIRNVNKKGRDDKVNRSIQAFLHRVVTTHGQEEGEEETATDIAAKRATSMVCELYRRRVWTDDRTVAILASAAVSKNTTVMSRALRFFLNIEEKMAEDQKQAQDEEWDSSNRIDFHQYSKKTKNREARVRRAVKNRKKTQQKRESEDYEMENINHDKGVEASKKLYPAIELLRDPQGLAEAVFKRLRASGSIKYETKLLMMNFVTRLVGNHELLLLPLYPFLQKYMGGHQRDVTAVLAYSIQACHEHVPPDEVYGILKTIAHNFITERCSEEQMAVGINAARAICARVPSALSVEESQESTGSTAMDVEAFVRDLAAFSNHRDRSVGIAGKAWTNFIRETYPSLLAGKNRGLQGSALHRAGVKPIRYGEQKAASGVEGADLLVEYESKKAAYRKKMEQRGHDGEDGEESMNEEDEDSDDESAPQLVILEEGDAAEGGDVGEDEGGEDVIDVSKMTPEERDKLKQEVSSTRVFSATDFEKMRKLVAREQRAKRDPREAARRKRAIAKGKEFEELSDDDSDASSVEEEVRIAGVVNPSDIMAEAKKKRQTKLEKLEKIVAGREKFESKERMGGSTNVEKRRKKNFMMTKFSQETRGKHRGKKGLNQKRKSQMRGHETKKRRRKF